MMVARVRHLSAVLVVLALADPDAALASPSSVSPAVAKAGSEVQLNQPGDSRRTPRAPRRCRRRGVRRRRVRPGDSIQAAIDRNPPGTIFCLWGRYRIAAPIRPKPGDVFRGPAVIKPAGPVETAFTARDVPEVIFKRLDISGFLLRAIEPGERNVVRGCFLHHNGRNGLGAGSMHAALIEDNELAFNGSDVELGKGASGMKIANSSGVVVRDNYVHDNVGDGIWFDVDSRGALIEGNVATRNTRRGIFFEISKGAVIRWNIAQDNNTSQHSVSGGIATVSSQDVQIYGNTLGGNMGHGVNVWDDSRSYVPENISVHQNVLNGDEVAGCDVPGVLCHNNF
jgi:parallel beta-helix repeat protein